MLQGSDDEEEEDEEDSDEDNNDQSLANGNEMSVLVLLTH